MKNLVLIIISIVQVSFGQTLTGVSSFGTNPGNLNMYFYAPSGILPGAPLVVVLHGCTQNAAQASAQTGWNKLADANKFYVVYPEQKAINNVNNCFNWFLGGDQNKNQGENLSIKQMVDYMKLTYTIDTSKVFITGLSAGAAMTEIACATYPEVYAAGAVMAGGPYKSATTAFEASNAMNGLVTKTPADWANLVYAQNPAYTGSYPRMAFFHGTSDMVVNYNNMNESVKQWTAVHQTDQTIDASISNYSGNPFVTMNSYLDANYTEVVRSYPITNFGHAIALDTGSCPQQGGQTATYAYDINFHSTWHAAHFFGLINQTATTLIINGPTGGPPNQTSVPYSVAANATSTFNWAAPATATIASGQGTNSITVDFGNTGGIISVYETMNGGCINGPEELAVNFVCICSGLSETQNNNSSIVVFENNNKHLFVKGITETNTIINVYDVLGKMILHENTSDESVSLQLPSCLSEGIYCVEVLGRNTRVNKKIIIR